MTMNTRELLWAVIYARTLRDYWLDRDTATRIAGQAVEDFDAFFGSPQSSAEGETSQPDTGDEIFIDAIESREPVEEFEKAPTALTDPLTWTVDEGVYRHWCELHHWPLDDERRVPALRQLVARAHYVKTLAAGRELWRTSANRGGWRLVVEPRDEAPSAVAWVGQGRAPIRFKRRP